MTVECFKLASERRGPATAVLQYSMGSRKSRYLARHTFLSLIYGAKKRLYFCPVGLNQLLINREASCSEILSLPASRNCKGISPERFLTLPDAQ